MSKQAKSWDEMIFHDATLETLFAAYEGPVPDFKRAIQIY